MDNDHLEVNSRNDSHEQECHIEKEGYVEALGAEVPDTSIRRSSRLQSKKLLSSCSQDIFRSFHSSSKHTMKSSKSRLNQENSISECKRNESNGVFSADTTSIKSSTVVPSFKYHVQANEGIPLVVDLNLKRSDWLRSLQKSVCVCQNHLKPGFESFRKEVECLRGQNNNLKTTASDTSMNSYVENNFSLKSSTREIEENLNSVVENCSVNSLSGPEFARENITVQENCSRKAECAEMVAFSSEEIQISDFSSHPKDSSCSRTGKICYEKLLASTTEVNQEASGNNGERNNSAEGMEVSGREENANEPKRKKSDHKSDQIYCQSHERILRSTKLFGGQIVESGGLVIKRSSRLFPKRGSSTPGYIYK